MYLIEIEESELIKANTLAGPNSPFREVMEVCHWLVDQDRNCKFEIAWTFKDIKTYLGAYLGAQAGWSFREDVLIHIA